MARHLKTSYIIYPPDYDPWDGDGSQQYKTCKHLRKAVRIAVGMGSGAEIYKSYKRWHKPSNDGYYPSYTMSWTDFWRRVR